MLLTVFQELQLEVARFLTNPSDCAALCLAVPRGLGLAALRHRELPQYKDILVSVALRLATGELQFDEALLRRYIWDRRMTPGGCEWLTAAAQKAGSPLGIVRSVDQSGEELRLTNGGADGALVRQKYESGRVVFFEGERNAEREVREEDNGFVILYEGEKDAERMVRTEQPNGSFALFEGERLAERMVRFSFPSGTAFVFEGERGTERKVRREHHDSWISFYEGEQGAERKVRVEHPDGNIIFYEGEKGAERKVRHELPQGRVIFFEGERRAERIVREERPDGTVIWAVLGSA